MSEVEEVSKAVQSVAKFGEKSLDSADKLGGFLAKVFKEPFAELSGMITDKLRFVRWKRLVKIADEVDKILEERGVKDTRPVPPKIAFPLLEEASLEDQDDLHSLWNRLLANAMDPDFHGEIRTAYIEIIKNITSLDAKILSGMYSEVKRHNIPAERQMNIFFSKDKICRRLSLSESDYLVSMHNLMRMQCVETFLQTLTMGGGLSGPDIKVPSGADKVVLTPLGIAFVEACG